MLKIHKLGQEGERIACDFLIKKYIVLERNWRWKNAEIDIICIETSTLIFVEVKCRSSEKFGQPHEFVNEKKQKLMIDAAEAYLDLLDKDYEERFNIISIILSKLEFKIDHISEAF